jgi:Uma2 family endonuclease
VTTAPALPHVPVEEYLHSSWRPDREYVNGVVVERSLPTGAHSLLQVILIAHFRALERNFKIKVFSEWRTQITKDAKYRIPDILLRSWPAKITPVLTDVPIAVIEILSPDDKVKDVLERFQDYESLGVPHIILMDPEQYTAHRYSRGSLLRTEFQSLAIPGPEECGLPFDSEALLRQIRAEVEEGSA